MITFAQCAAFAGLSPCKIILGISPSAAHRSLLSSYLVNLWRGPEVVRDMIVTDIGMSVDLGALKHAADLLIVLRQFLSDYPDARLEQHPSKVNDRNNVISLTTAVLNGGGRVRTLCTGMICYSTKPLCNRPAFDRRKERDS